MRQNNVFVTAVLMIKQSLFITESNLKCILNLHFTFGTFLNLVKIVHFSSNIFKAKALHSSSKGPGGSKSKRRLPGLSNHVPACFS